VDREPPDDYTISGQRYVLTGVTEDNPPDGDYKEGQEKNIKSLLEWAQGRSLDMINGSLLSNEQGVHVLVDNDFASAETREYGCLISVVCQDADEPSYCSERVQVVHSDSALTGDHLDVLHEYVQSVYRFDFDNDATIEITRKRTYKTIAVGTDPSAETTFETEVGFFDSDSVGVRVYCECPLDIGQNTAISGLYIANPDHLREEYDGQGGLTMYEVDLHWLEKIPSPTIDDNAQPSR
jgi:hypothetical protein